MTIKLINGNAEFQFLEMIDSRCKSGLHLCNILVFSFSKINFKKEPEEFLVLLKDALDGTLAELYLCEDNDLFIYWHGQELDLTRVIIEKFMNAYPVDLGFIKEDAIVSIFDTNTEERKNNLRLFILRKMAAPEKNQEHARPPPISDPKNYIKLELDPLQKQVFDMVLPQKKNRIKPEILIVEDQDFSRKLLMGLLQKNYTCYGAKDANQAFHLFAHHAPDIVFLDIELPDQSGHGLASLFKNLDPQVFVVMVTGNNYPADVERAKKNKVQRFIAKPYSKQIIFSSLEAYSKRKSAKGKI